MEGLLEVGVVQLLSVRIREELGEGVLEGILEVVVLVVVGQGVGEGVDRCGICMGQGIRLLGLMRIDLLFKERELLWIGWNMEKDMFEMFVFTFNFFFFVVRNETHNIGTLFCSSLDAWWPRLFTTSIQSFFSIIIITLLLHPAGVISRLLVYLLEIRLYTPSPP
jgi:hypothetical protein